MQKRIMVGVGVGMAYGAGALVFPGISQAATATLTSLPVDQLAVTFYNSLINVWIPIIAVSGMIALAINMFVGFVHVGPKVVGFCFAMAILALGLPGLSSLFGDGLVTAAVLP